MKSSCCVSAGPWRPLTWILHSGESMSSLIQGPQPIWLPTQPFYSLTTESWGWTCPTVASEYGWGGWLTGSLGHMVMREELFIAMCHADRTGLSLSFEVQCRRKLRPQ